MLMGMGCTRLEGACSSVRALRRPSACSLAHTPSCASGLHALGRRVGVGDMCASGHAICLSGRHTLLDARFETSRNML